MRFAGIPLATAGTIIFLSRIGDVLGVLLSGSLADLCKRRMVAYFAIGLTTLLSYPLFLVEGTALKTDYLLKGLTGTVVLKEPGSITYRDTFYIRRSNPS
jgi:Na+/melibiose symporter-like transporter